MRFVRLTAIEDSYEANFLKEDLGEAGIPSFLTNEHMTNLLPMSFGPAAMGIQVMVRPEDLDKAREVMALRSQVKKMVSCPHCESMNIRLGRAQSNIRLSTLLLGLLGIIAPIDPRDRYFCNNCMKEFMK